MAWLTDADRGPTPAQRDRTAITELVDVTCLLGVAGRLADRITRGASETPVIQRQAEVAMEDALVHVARRHGWRPPPR